MKQGKKDDQAQNSEETKSFLVDPQYRDVIKQILNFSFKEKDAASLHLTCKYWNQLCQEIAWQEMQKAQAKEIYQKNMETWIQLKKLHEFTVDGNVYLEFNKKLIGVIKNYRPNSLLTSFFHKEKRNSFNEFTQKLLEVFRVNNTDSHKQYIMLTLYFLLLKTHATSARKKKLLQLINKHFNEDDWEWALLYKEHYTKTFHLMSHLFDHAFELNRNILAKMPPSAFKEMSDTAINEDEVMINYKINHHYFQAWFKNEVERSYLFLPEQLKKDFFDMLVNEKINPLHVIDMLLDIRHGKLRLFINQEDLIHSWKDYQMNQAQEKEKEAKEDHSLTFTR